MTDYNIAEARKAVRFSKAALLDWLKCQEQKKAAQLSCPMTDGLRQMTLAERMLIHRLIKKIQYNRFSSDL